VLQKVIALLGLETYSKLMLSYCRLEPPRSVQFVCVLTEKRIVWSATSFIWQIHYGKSVSVNVRCYTNTLKYNYQ